MRRVLCAMLIFTIVLSIAGCKGGSGDSRTPATSQAPPSEQADLPSQAAPPETMPIEELLRIANAVAGKGEQGETIFDINNAIVYDALPDIEGDMTQYFFDIGKIEAVVFLAPESGNVASAYLRSLLDDEVTELYMFSYASAFLRALEPNEYGNILDAIQPEDMEDFEENYEYNETASGEFWSAFYSHGFVSIMPKEE